MTVDYASMLDDMKGRQAENKAKSDRKTKMIAKGIGTGIGAVFAPMTGGASLAIGSAVGDAVGSFATGDKTGGVGGLVDAGAGSVGMAKGPGQAPPPMAKPGQFSLMHGQPHSDFEVPQLPFTRRR